MAEEHETTGAADAATELTSLKGHYVHPVARLFNAERLYYVLIQSLEPMPEDRNAISSWLKDSKLLNSSTLDVIWGEADLLIRVWATSGELDKFLRIVNDQGRHRFRIRSLLLVNDMDVCYQRALESSTLCEWDWHAITDWLDKLKRAPKKSACLPENPCLRLPSNARKPRASKHLVRFWVFCEGYAGNQWRFFEMIRNYVLNGEFPKLYGVEEPGTADPADRAEKGRRQLREVSFYSYEEVQTNPKQFSVPYAKEANNWSFAQPLTLSKGIIVKGEFEIEPPHRRATPTKPASHIRF